MLSVRYGPFRSLGPALLDELEALQEGDPLASVAVVAPSSRMAQGLQALAAGRRAWLGVRFHTFLSLSLEMALEAGETRRLLRDGLFFDLLVDSLLGPGRRPRGLAASFRATIKDLVDAGVGPGSLEVVCDAMRDRPEEALRLRSLIELAGRFESRLERMGAAGPSFFARRACELAESSPVLKRFKALLYYGFYDLTGAQADFFEAVSREHPVTLFFPYRKGRPAYAFAGRLFESRLHQGGASPRPAAGAADGEARPPARMKVFTASGACDECWRAAKEILRLVEEEGYRFDEIGVVARSLEQYRAPLFSALSRSAVPFRSSEAEPLLMSPGARAVWTLLSVNLRDFPAPAVRGLLLSPFFKKPRPGWPELLSGLRLRGGWPQWSGRLRAEGGAEALGLARLLGSWREALSFEGRAPWSEWASRCLALVGRNLDGRGDEGFSAALAGVESLASFDALGPVRFPEFLDACLERLVRSRRPPAGDCPGVRVLDAMQARGESFRALFLIGLRQGLFPRVIREDPLLGDETRSFLRDALGYWMPVKAEGYAEERLLFELLVESAGDLLVCSTPRSDEEGRLQAPSLYLLELCRERAVDLGAAESVPRQPLERLASPGLWPFLTPREASLACALSGKDASALHEALGFDAGGLSRLRGRALGLNRPGEAGAQDGVVGPDPLFLSRLRRRGLSPSALESLASCPFRFFASRLLGLPDPGEPSEAGRLDERLRGEMLHRALADFHASLLSCSALPGGPFPGELFARVCGDALPAGLWERLGLYPLVWEVERGKMAGSLRAFLEWDLSEISSGSPRPVLIEAEMEGPLPLGGARARLGEALAGIPLRGRLDRVDAGGGRFRVVDYKARGRRESLPALVGKGETLQPPLYLELASRAGALSGLDPAGVLFVHLEGFRGLRPGERRLSEYGPGDHEALLPGLSLRLEALLSGLAQGRFVVSPDEGEFGRCRRCAFASICRKNHPMTLARSRGAP